MRRRSAILGLLSLPLAARAETAGSCGCGPKSNPNFRAEQLYRAALASDDPATKVRLLREALRLQPDNAAALKLLQDLGETP